MDRSKIYQEHFFKAAITENDFPFCIFYSEAIGAMIKVNIAPRSRKYLIDGSFQIVPYGWFAELLVLYVEYLESKVI